eukprot:857396-Pyramimonas_sp.AAC.2
MQNPKPCRVTLCAKGPQNTRTCDRHAHITHILNDAVGVGVIGHRHRHVGGHLRGAFGEHLGNIQGTFREHMVGVGADRHEQRTGGTTSHAREEARIRQPGPGGHQRRQPGVCARARAITRRGFLSTARTPCSHVQSEWGLWLRAAFVDTTSIGAVDVRAYIPWHSTPPSGSAAVW